MSLFAAIEKSKKNEFSPSKILTTPTGSPLSYNSNIEKQSAKKKQSSLKGFVNTFVKLIISLRGDMEQIQLLLENLIELYTISLSIYTAAIKNVNKNKITIDINKNDQKIQNIIYRHKVTVFDTFPNIGPTLLAKVLIDIDSVNSQIHQFMRSIGDYLAAMKLCSHDAINCVIGEHPNIFSEIGTIFTTEHALNMQQITCQCEEEYDRMKNLLKPIKTNENKDMRQNMPDNIQYWKSFLEKTTKIYESWGEESKFSCLDSDLIDLFIITNKYD